MNINRAELSNIVLRKCHNERVSPPESTEELIFSNYNSENIIIKTLQYIKKKNVISKNIYQLII